MKRCCIEAAPAAARIDWDSVLELTLIKERIPVKGTPSAGMLRGAVVECVKLARHLARPAAMSRKFRVTATGGGPLELEGGIQIAGKSLARAMDGARQAAIFIVTIGDDLESTATMLMDYGEELHGYLLDRIGSFAVESMAESLEGNMRSECMAKGLGVSMRYSPGYCDTPLCEQKKLDAAVGFSKVGVSLNENLMMLPRKSISGVIGIGPAKLFSKAAKPCDVCDMKECDYKRVAAISRS